MKVPRIATLSSSEYFEQKFDICFWFAGYEARSSWLIQSEFWPTAENAVCYRIEVTEDRNILSARENLKIKVGQLFGGRPESRNYDGHWRICWKNYIFDCYKKLGRKINIFVDISSMPRTIYGPLIIESFTESNIYIKTLTLAYVSGEHEGEMDSHLQLDGLRTLTGLEGASRFNSDPAFILGLGFDGALSHSIIDLFQIDRYSVFYADPAFKDDYVKRCTDANRIVISSAELIERAPSWDISATLNSINHIADWYSATNDILIVPMGPKTQIVSGIILSLLKPNIGFRSVQSQKSKSIQVTVANNTSPYFNIIDFEDYDNTNV